MMQNMKRSEFYEFVRDQIRNHLPDGFSEIRVFDVESSTKKYKGLTADKPGQSVSVNPVVNLDMFYEQYSEGADEDAIMSEMVKIITETPFEHAKEVTSYLLDWEKVQERLFVSVMNVMKVNTTVYETVAGDLVLVVRVLINTEGGISSVVVTDKLLEQWNATAQQAFDIAKKNTPSIFGVKISEPEKNTGMFIVSNDKCCMGAAVIFLPGVAEQISEKTGGDFFVIPSSLDETICAPVVKDVDTDIIKHTIKCVNEECVSTDNILSYKLYKYNSSNKNFEEV